MEDAGRVSYGSVLRERVEAGRERVISSVRGYWCQSAIVEVGLTLSEIVSQLLSRPVLNAVLVFEVFLVNLMWCHVNSD